MLNAIRSLVSNGEGNGSNGSGNLLLGAITKVGIWAGIVLFLLGALDGIPGIKSPVTRIIDSNERSAHEIAASNDRMIGSITSAIREHDYSQIRRDERGEETRRQLVDTMSALLRQLTMMDQNSPRRR